MANALPKILYDNALDGATLSATDTATGYDVDNITDLRPYTLHRFSGSGTKYITADCGTSLLDEDCSDISDWTDGDVGTAVSEVDPAGQFRFDTNAGAAGDAYAWRYRYIATIPEQATIEIKLYHDLIGTIAGDDYFRVDITQEGTRRINIAIASDGICFNFLSGFGDVVCQGLVKSGGAAEWQTWKFVVDFETDSCDIYLTDSTYTSELVATVTPCLYLATWQDGLVNLIQRGSTTDNMVTHVDYVKIYTSKTANALGIVGHNLGTASATVSVESSPDNSNWTERLAGFQPSDDTAILKEFDQQAFRYWRLKIVTASVTAQLGVALLGEILTFERIMSAQGFDPFPEKIIAASKNSKTGNLLGVQVSYVEATINPFWRMLTTSWLTNTFKPAWDDHLSLLKPFLWAWDITDHSSEIYFVRIPDGFTLSLPLVPGNPSYRPLRLSMQGVKE